MPKNSPSILVGLVLGIFLFFPMVLQAQTTVFLKPAEAIKMIFKDSQEVYKEDYTLTPEQKTKAKELLKYIPPQDHLTFFVGKTSGKIDGYALIDEQVGKVLPITFITRISPKGKVQDVEIMVYRESHGSEVKSKRFLRQFEQKDIQQDLRLRDNIINVTGATLSSQALVIGVRRAIVLWNLIYGTQATSPA